MTVRRRSVTFAVAALATIGLISGCDRGSGPGPGASSTSAAMPTTSKPPSTTTAANGREDRFNIPAVPDGDPMHALDLYLPDRSKGPVPVLVWVHGGGWRMGDKSDVGYGDITVGRLRDDLLGQGIAVASVNYHLLPQGTKFPQPMQDVSAGVRYLKAHAAELGLDPQRFALGGESAGAHLGAMVSYAPKDSPLHGTLGEKADPSVRAFLGYYGIYDFTTRTPQQKARGCGSERTGAESSHGRLIGADPDSAQGRPAALAASPITYVTAASPPALLYHGRQDCTAPFEQSEQLGEKLLAAGVGQKVILIDAGHADNQFYLDDGLRREAVQFLVNRLKS